MPYEIRDTWIDQVKQAVDIVDVVGQHVALKRKGRHWWGICPFHSEKTASFSVDAEQQLFYCFGCHQGGTVFTFLMKLEGREFREVVESLAEQVGIPRPDSDRRSSDPHQRLRAVMEWTQDYFLENQRQHREHLVEYFNERGVDLTVVEQFAIGYAPDAWQGLVEVLTRRGVRLEEMIQAGVVVKRDSGGGYDRWRGRLMFPIWDAERRVVAFGGRALLPDQEPKYLNSPETPLFHKGQLLYGTHLARPGWRKAKQGILVEGYFDVMACHQAGLTQAVGLLGTALTDAQARYLSRYCDTMDLLLDQDAAGQEAIRRSFLILSGTGMKVNVIMLPPQVKDPSELVQKLGMDALRTCSDNKLPYVEREITRLAQLPGLMSPRGRAEAVETVKPLIQAVKDPVERSGYLEMVSKAFRVQTSILTQSFGSWQGSQHINGKNRHNMEVAVSAQSSVPTLEVRLLAALKNHPDQIARVKIALPQWAGGKAVAIILEELLQGHFGDPAHWTEQQLDPEVESLMVAVWQYQEPDGGNADIDDLVIAMERRETYADWNRLRERARQGDVSPELMSDIRRIGQRIAQYQGRKEG